MTIGLIRSNFAAMKLCLAVWLPLVLLVWQAIPSRLVAQEPVSEDWGRIHAGSAFSFEAPAGTKAAQVRGIDSFVGAYVANGFSIGFDYGRWSNELQGAPGWDSIDGRASKYESDSAKDCAAFPGDNTQGRFEVYLYVAPPPGYVVRAPGAKLTIHGCARDQKGLRDLQRLFRSIRFGPA